MFLFISYCSPSGNSRKHCILKGMYQIMNELFNRTCLTNETEEHSLAALLENSKKNRLKSIASRYGLKLSDKNTKPQMIQAASPAIEVNFSIKLKQYSNDELALLLNCFLHSEVGEETAAAIASSAPFEDGGVYLIAKKDKFYPVIPPELAGKIMSRCVSRYFGSKESELARTAKACARIYGTFTAKELANAVNAAYEANVTQQQAEEFLSGAQAEEFAYANGVAVYTLGSPAATDELAENLDYDLPSRKEIEAYAFYGLDTSDYYYRQIVTVVYNNAGNTFDRRSDAVASASHRTGAAHRYAAAVQLHSGHGGRVGGQNPSAKPERPPLQRGRGNRSHHHAADPSRRRQAGACQNRTENRQKRSLSLRQRQEI